MYTVMYHTVPLYTGEISMILLFVEYIYPAAGIDVEKLFIFKN